MRQHALITVLTFGLISLSAHSGLCAERQGLQDFDPAPATKAEISFYVGEIAKGQHWAIVLEPHDNISGFLVNPGYVTPIDTAGMDNSDGRDVGRLSSSRYNLADSEFRFRGPSSVRQSVYVAAQIAAAKSVSVYENGAVVFHGRITSPTLIIDGKILPSTPLPLQKAICLMALPQAVEDFTKPDLATDSEGVLRANTALMRQHLQTLPSIGENLDGQPLELAQGALTLILVRIHVDTFGHVTGTHVLTGEDPLSSAAIKALAEARFKPFLSNGRAVEVEGVVQYSMSGKLIETSIN